MIARTNPTASWYLLTAGVGPDDDYKWYALDSSDNPMVAADVVAGDFAGHRFRQLVSESKPSTLLGRRMDGAFVFYTNRLRPSNAPMDGDHVGRPISVAVLGIAPTVDSVTELVNATTAVLTGRLADNLPVSWDRGTPVVSQSVNPPWVPPVRSIVPNGHPPRLRTDEGQVLPEENKLQAAELLAGLTPRDLGAFPVDRPLLLASDLPDVDDLRAIKPWLAITRRVSAREPLKEGKRRRQATLAGAILVVVVLAWVVWRIVGTS